ncbi:MAG: AI-2E family transporter [Polyangiaceae bacterium]
MFSDRPPPSIPAPVSTPTQRRALAVLALLSVAALAYLAFPVASGLFFGTLLAFSLLRLHERLSARLGRPGVSASLLALGAGLVIVGTVGGLVYLMIARGAVAANTLATGFDPQGSLRKSLARLDEFSRTSPFGPIDVSGRVAEAATVAASKLSDWAAVVAGATFSAVLTLFFTILTTFFMLRHWVELMEGAERMLPLHPLHTRVVLSEFQKVGKEVFVGTMLTGIIQGVLGGVSYALAGAPEAALLAALTAISSLVPIIGTALVWIPVGVVLMVTGELGSGLFVLVWGTVLVGLAGEYLVRPRLVGGKKSHVPSLITFISLIGGVQVFGLPGLVVGPVVASVALAVLKTYDRAVCKPLDPSSVPPGSGPASFD